MTRLKFVANVVAGQSPPSADVSELLHGRPFLQGNAEFGQLSPAPKWEAKNSPKSADAGDILISVRAPVGSLNVADQSYGIGRGLAAVQTFSADRSFVWWWLHTQVALLDSESTGSTFKAINSRVLENLECPDIGLSEQRAIADYLDRETQKIDELIAEQRGLIETLRERWTSISENLFGKYVAGSSRLRWFLEDIDQRAGEKRRELPLFSVSIDWGVRRRSGDINQAEGDLTRYKVARRGDIVLNRMRAFQGALGVAPEDGLVSPDYSVLRTADALNSEWLSLVMRSPSFVGQMVSRIRGIGGVTSGSVRTPRLNFSDLREIPIDIPDLDLQSRDLNAMLHEVSRIDELISESEDLIALSQERRAALITAAVTGQIDVREAV